MTSVEKTHAAQPTIDDSVIKQITHPRQPNVSNRDLHQSTDYHHPTCKSVVMFLQLLLTVTVVMVYDGTCMIIPFGVMMFLNFTLLALKLDDIQHFLDTWYGEMWYQFECFIE